MLTLPSPSPQYSPENEAQARAALQRNDKDLMRKSQDVNLYGRRLIIPSPNGSLWEIKVSNEGAISAVAL